MLTKEKQKKFKEIARELIVQEYLGVDGYGLDKEYEDEMTEAGADYLVSVFMNTQDLCTKKEPLLNIMNKREIKHKSNILKLIL